MFLKIHDRFIDKPLDKNKEMDNIKFTIKSENSIAS